MIINLAFGRVGGIQRNDAYTHNVAQKWLVENVMHYCETVLDTMFGNDGVVSFQGMYFNSNSAFNVLIYKVRLTGPTVLNRAKLKFPDIWIDLQQAIKCFEEYANPKHEGDGWDKYFDVHLTPEELQEKYEEYEKYFLEG